MSGHDEFDDFELTILVHEAMFEKKESKLTTMVRVTAGPHEVKTDTNSNGIFQQPLNVTVEQGAHTIMVDLLDSHERMLASLPLDTMEHVLGPSGMQSEMIYNMKPKGKGIRNPKIKLTMICSSAVDEESVLLSGVSTEVDIFMRQQKHKAEQEGRADAGMSEIDLLKDGCSGPLELFEGLGKTANVYAAVLGPPVSRRWALGIWSDKHKYDAKSKAIQEVDLLKVKSVQADPSRHHVFVVNYVDESRHRQSLTFRRIDRARDVWVEMLHVLVRKVHDAKEATRQERQKTGKATGSITGSKSFNSSWFKSVRK
jgi:hypothetical protein